MVQGIMRLFLWVFLGGMQLATLRAEEAVSADPYDPFAGVPTPLAEAMRSFAQDAPRWAYTQRFVQYDRKGAVKEQWVARHDPSQHYDVQWTLLERDGRPPTEAQQKKFRKARAKMQQQGRKSLGELLELKRATLVPDQADAALPLTYEVPLRPDEEGRLPPEKFQVLVRVERATHRLASIDVKLRERFRVALLVNVKAGDARIEFTPVLPAAGPAITKIEGGGTVSVLLVPFGGRVEATRTDFKRVTPYDDRFVVKPGPLRTIDF